MSAYEELIDRCCDIDNDRSWESRGARIKAILAEILRTLEMVTDEMRGAALDLPADIHGEDDYYLAMLHASPLERPK
jgi:hypothetical protein